MTYTIPDGQMEVLTTNGKQYINKVDLLKWIFNSKELNPELSNIFEAQIKSLATSTTNE